MSIKTRFALVITFLFAIVLTITVSTIYGLYLNNRKEDFYQRIRQEGLNIYFLYIENLQNKKEFYRHLDDPSENALFDNAIFLYDKNVKLLFRSIDSSQSKNHLEKIKEAKLKNEFRFSEDNREGIVIYDNKTGITIITSAYDKFGYKKLERLKSILTIVYFIGLILTAIISFVFVQKILKPLTALRKQMQRISESNLKERVKFRKGNDEINSIAKSFNEMLDRLESAFQIQKNFVNHASHELRTPLAVMISHSEVALRNAKTIEEFKTHIKSIHEDLKSMNDLTNSLISLSKFDNKVGEKMLPDVRVDDILYEIINEIQQVYPLAIISIEFLNMPDDEKEFEIKADTSLLKAIFRNLLKNACHYSDNEKVHVFIKTLHKQLIIIIENTGDVINSNEKNQLFIPFFRGSNSTNKKGFGLGLSIVQRLILVHDGTIQYESVGSQLNRFTVTFKK